MKKQKVNKTPIAIFRDGVFCMRVDRHMINGKLLNCRVPNRGWSDSYNRWYEQAHQNQIVLEALKSKIADATEPDVKKAYQEEFKKALQGMKGQRPDAPSRLYDIKMRVVGYDVTKDHYILEGATDKAKKKLAELGY